MKTFLRYYLKYIILAAVFIVAIAVVGVMNVGNIEKSEEKKSSYTRTMFDYYISSPDKKQVEEIESSASVDRVFPFYAFKNAFPEKNSAKEVMLLASDDMDDSEISLITTKTCISGKYDKNGAMLDNLAAQRLGVKVGDKISFTVGLKRFTLNVSGIYLTSTYGTLAKGIVLVDFTDEMKSTLNPVAYGGAFITANDKAGVSLLLKDYAGEGNVALTYEQFVDLRCGTKPPTKTEAEFEAECRAKYEDYRKDELDKARRGGAQVAVKEEAYTLIKDMVETTERGVENINLTVAVASGVLFLILNIVFTVTNRKNDLLRRDDGMRYIVMAGLYSLTSLVTAAVIAAAGFGFIYMAAAKTFFLAECMKTALYCSLPVLIAAPVVIAFVFIYLSRMYANSAVL